MLIFLLLYFSLILAERSGVFRLKDMPPYTKLYINARQIRAARALLDWSQEVLAVAADLSIATIRKIETGQILPHGKTLEKIQRCFEAANIEFTPSSGLRLRGNNLMMIEGNDAFLQLLEDVKQTVLRTSSDILFLYNDGTTDTEEEIEAANAIRILGTRWRFICAEENTHLRYPLEEYRWLPKKYFKRNLQLIYGNKVAMSCHVDLRSNTTTEIVVVESPSLAASNRNLFNFMWDNCRRPSHTTASKIYA